MTDDRHRSSSSDELLREARQRVLDGELYSDDHLETSSSDTYGSHTFEDEATDSASDDNSATDGVELSAAEIAEQLAEAREAANPRPPASSASGDTSADRSRSGTSSLPDWALDDEPSPSAGTHRIPEPSAAPAPSGTLAERIRALAEEQGEPVPLDIPAGQLQVPPPTDMESDVWSTPTTEWEARQAAKSSKTATTSWVKPVISLVVFAVFGVGFIAAQLDGSEPIDQLAVGDCFDAGDAAEVYSVPVIDCNELHSSELYGTVEVTAFDSTYPDEEVLFNWVNEKCEEQFSGYVGEPYEDSRYWIEVFYPTEDGWDEGDRGALCTVVLVDGNFDVRPSLGSAKGWGERTA
ncbi:MAG: septum formation family protein [Acidimicrobiia bacterium]|jgi:hypothetical protein